MLQNILQLPKRWFTKQNKLVQPHWKTLNAMLIDMQA